MDISFYRSVCWIDKNVLLLNFLNRNSWSCSNGAEREDVFIALSSGPLFKYKTKTDINKRIIFNTVFVLGLDSKMMCSRCVKQSELYGRQCGQFITHQRCLFVKSNEIACGHPV